MKLLSLFLFCLPLQADSCSFAKVEWSDAMIWTKQAGEKMIPPFVADVVSVGCVQDAPDGSSLLVIFSSVHGKPDVYLAIPKGWVKAVTPLKEVNNEPKEIPQREKGGK